MIRPGRLYLGRDTHFFVDHASRIPELQERCRTIPLASDQLLHPLVPRHYVVRQGKLRISEFLDDGREVVRAVLQAGATIRTLDPSHPEQRKIGENPATDVYSLAKIVIMALGETELWSFADAPRL